MPRRVETIFFFPHKRLPVEQNCSDLYVHIYIYIYAIRWYLWGYVIGSRYFGRRIFFWNFVYIESNCGAKMKKSKFSKVLRITWNFRASSGRIRQTHKRKSTDFENVRAIDVTSKFWTFWMCLIYCFIKYPFRVSTILYDLKRIFFHNRLNYFILVYYRLFFIVIFTFLTQCIFGHESSKKFLNF